MLDDQQDAMNKIAWTRVKLLKIATKKWQHCLLCSHRILTFNKQQVRRSVNITDNKSFLMNGTEMLRPTAQDKK